MIVVCSAVLSVAATAQLAHSYTSLVHGVVTDSSGATIPGAMVTISTSHWTHTVSTNDSGEYSVSGLVATEDRHCKVTIRYGGFAPFEKSTFVLAPGMETEADAQLEIRQAHQSVTVYE